MKPRIVKPMISAIVLKIDARVMDDNTHDDMEENRQRVNRVEV